MRSIVTLVACLILFGCRTGDGASTAMSEDGVSMYELPRDVKLLRRTPGNTTQITEALPLVASAFDARNLDCNPMFGRNGNGEKICRPRMPQLQDHCIDGNMNKACNLFGVLSKKSLQRYADDGLHDRTVMTSCQLTERAQAVRVEVSMTSDFPELDADGEAEIRAEAVVRRCDGGVGDVGGSAIIHLNSGGAVEDTFPDSANNYDVDDVTCVVEGSEKVCAPKAIPLGHVCVYGNVAETCNTLKSLSQKSERAYGNGAHDKTWMKTCNLANGGAEVVYSMTSDNTDYRIDAKAFIKACAP